MMHSKNEDTHLHVHPLEEENEANGSPDHDTSAEDEDEYPDGGWRAWSVVLGAWCALIPTFGIANTVGVFEEWLASHQLHEHPKSTVSWIFSLFIFFLYVAGVQVGMLVFSARFTRIASLTIHADMPVKRSYIRRLWDEVPAFSRIPWDRGIPHGHECLNWSACLPLFSRHDSPGQ